EEEGIDPRTVKRALRSLRERDLITVEKRGRGPNTSNTYVLAPHLVGDTIVPYSQTSRGQTTREKGTKPARIGGTDDPLTGKEPVGNRAPAAAALTGRASGVGKDTSLGVVPALGEEVRA